MRGRGFTLIELLVAVTIVAILTATAYPAYRNHVIRSQLVDATSALADMRVRMEQFYADNRTYASGSDCGVAMPTLERFTLSCTLSNSNQAYLITATGNTGSPVAGFAYSIDQANTRKTVSWVSAWGTVPASGATRWLIKKE
ncbi:MAG: prepilin-type N-terminal cleavage/methylation domain-containing protein [Betaproteobacteria bacterium]|nr:prepilin-type N-terminal cleavage/methylation domain-containing protein [Betaproteobacteria bacterium]